MLFLGPVYRFVQASWFGSVNHWPLLRLVFYSLDKSLLYLLVFAALRIGYLLLKRQRPHVGHEVRVFAFVFYLLLLLALTVFRDVYYPWQLVLHWHRSLSVINFTPFVETWKLRQGVSQFDFWYQSLGNIMWFLPFGWGMAALWGKKHFLAVTFAGIGLSVMIETLQFLLISGVADIDDVIFNVTGVVVGYISYRITQHR